MGQVFRGVHARSRTPVAVKVLAGERAIDPGFCAAFRDEVRAAASLDHPAIVMLFDQGTVTLAAERATKKQLTAGAPYLVMELVAHGTLVDLVRRSDGAARALSLSTLRAVLLDVLDALAHAHARGVIHRDIKPGNVMLAARPDALDPRSTLVKLTDFGIAWRMDWLDSNGESPRELNAFSGTPHYMAPEQAEGRLRDIGPWTDLYALGCVAYRLLAGKPPYHHTGTDAQETLRCQIQEPVPPIERASALPEALLRWLNTMLAKRWEDRFRCAADAAAALAEISIDEPSRTPHARSVETPAREPVTDDVATRVATAGQLLQAPREAPRTTAWSEPTSQQSTVLYAPGPSEPPPSPTRATLHRVATLPLDPAPKSAARRPIELVDAGLGLFALRPLPMIDRDRERSTLWRALFDVHTERAARSVVVRSPIGVGKSRLLDWFTTRAKELGGASVLAASHSANQGATDGIGPMIARALRTAGLPRAAAMTPTIDAIRRMGGRLSEAVALLEVTHPITDHERGDGASVRFANSKEREHAALRYIELLCRERPVIVRVDDAQWGLEALSLQRALLDPIRALPVLCVIDVDSDTIADREAERSQIDAIESHEASATIALEPLRREDQHSLVRALLSLAPALAQTVVERSEGNPLFAVQLVTDWVQRGIVRAGGAGFELTESAADAVPDELHTLLLGRVERAIGADAIAYAERAATLGASFDEGEWRDACSSISPAKDPIELESALVFSGVLRRAVSRRTFAHPMIVDSLLRAARERGSLAEHHRACARALAARAPAVGARARIARHLCLAGALEEALAPMLEAAWECYERSDYAGAFSALTERDRWIDALALPDSDERRAEGWLKLGFVCARLAKINDATAWFDRAEAFVREHRAPALEADLAQGRAKTAQMAGEMQTASALFARAIERYLADERPLGVAQCEHGLAEVLKQSGRANESEPHYERAREAYERCGDRVGAASCKLGHAELVLRTDRARGAALLDDAERALDSVGNRLGIAVAQQIKGLGARYDGALEDAHAAFLRCADMLEAIGSHDAAVARTNAGVIDLMRGQFVRAARIFEDAHRLFTALGREGYLCFATVELLACKAHFGEWNDFDQLLDEAERIVPKSGLIDEDLELCFSIAKERALAAGELDRAARIEPLLAVQRATINA